MPTSGYAVLAYLSLIYLILSICRAVLKCPRELLW